MKCIFIPISFSPAAGPCGPWPLGPARNQVDLTRFRRTSALPGDRPFPPRHRPRDRGLRFGPASGETAFTCHGGRQVPESSACPDAPSNDGPIGTGPPD